MDLLNAYVNKQSWRPSYNLILYSFMHKFSALLCYEPFIDMTWTFLYNIYNIKLHTKQMTKYLLEEQADELIIHLVLERYRIKFQGTISVVSALTETICPLGLKT